MEGGDVLKKNTNTLENYGIKDGAVLIYEQVERPPAVSREKKPKEESKLTVHYRMKGVAGEASKLEVPGGCKIK